MFYLILNVLKGSFRVNKLFFICLLVLVMLLCSLHFSFEIEEQSHKNMAMLNKENRFVSPEPNLFISKVPSIRNKTDADIDNERRELRRTERFNLMEEIYGVNWTDNFAFIRRLAECTLGK